jgi:serine/threonine-protein kinase
MSLNQGLANQSATGVFQARDAFYSPFEPDQIIADKYRVQKLIGVGGVCFVVAATHIRLDYRVALKFLRPEFAMHQEALTRLINEARATFEVRNDHIARIIDIDTLPDGTPFMVMELLEGLDLRRVLEARRYLPVELAVDFALETCEALAAAHACHIVHRDVKPENLFVSKSEQGEHIKLLDFGIAKLLKQPTPQKPVAKNPATALTLLAIGTAAYMSPEQVRLSKDLDSRADIWSLACVLYEMVSGTAPFQRMSLMQSFAAVLEEEPRSLGEACPQLPEQLDAVVQRCLRKDPAERFVDVAELARALAPFGARSVKCADRCSELLTKGVRSSDGGIWPSGPTMLRLSTPVEIATGTPPAKPNRSLMQQFPLPAPDVLPPSAATTPIPRAVPHPVEESSGEILTVADLKPLNSFWVIVVVCVLTVLSVTYVSIRLAKQAADRPIVLGPNSKDSGASQVTAVNASARGADAFLQAPQAPLEAFTPTPPHVELDAPSTAATRQAPTDATETAAPWSVRTTLETRTQPKFVPKPALKPSPKKIEDPDVGF